jgi:NADH:ubiquinone oxidoreductase subunit 2 (subunit N)
MVFIVVLMKVAQPQTSVLNDWAGLIQRCSLLTFYVWIFVFSLKLKKNVCI